MHLDERIEVPYPISGGKTGERKRRPRRLRQRGPTLSGPWREGTPERMSRPRSAQGDVAKAARVHAETGGRSNGHMAADRYALTRSDGAIAYITRAINIKVPVIGIVALVALALLSYGLLVLSPQQVAPLTAMSFTLPAAAATASSATHPPKQVEKRT